MPGSKLVRLKTDLKSLKYGHDRQGDGNSGQPYITAPIPNRLSTSPFDDGYIRGGRALAAKASKEDSLRISKFFNDKPKGPLFIARQIGLQLTNPKLETRQINLTGFGLLGNLLTAGFNTFNQLLPGPTRIYNDGKNTLAQISGTAFGEHFERHGLSPVQDDNTKYLAVAYNNNKNGNNRLLALKKKLIKPGISNPRSSNVILGTINAILGAVNVFNRAIGRGTNPLLPTSPLLQPADLIIDRYSGGPNSKYGIGLTTIRRFDVTSNGFNKFIPEKGKVDYTGLLGLSNQYFSPRENLQSNNIAQNNDTQNPFYINQAAVSYTQNIPAGTNGTNNSPTLRKYEELRNIIEKQSKSNQKYDVQGILQIKSFNNPNFSSYFSKKNQFDLANRVDADLMTIVFQAIYPFENITSGYNFNFSAYIKGFKDNFDATWNEYNYVGRSESFYTYSKFKRNVSFSFDIPCFNKTQLYEKHRALGQLASTTAGAYNTNGLLGGVLLKVKVGGYLNNEYAILNSISYDIPDDSSWDLDGTGDTSKVSIDKRNQLAMYLKVNVSLTIIHNDLPQYKVPDVEGNEKAGFFGHLPNPIARGNLPAQ
jgi:hypothetical protein